MNLGKSSRYALLAAMEMAAAGGRSLTAADLARRHAAPEAGVAKVLQRLVHAGIVVGTRGSCGGYRLARSPGSVTVLEILAVFDDALGREPIASAEPLDRLLGEVTAVVRGTFASVSLETLCGRT